MSEFTQWRDDRFAAESFLASEQEAPPDDYRQVPDANEPNGVCLCCGKWRYIPAMMHVCIPCFEDSEDCHNGPAEE